MFKRCFAALIFWAGFASAQNFTIVVPSGPGSFHDVAARHVAPAISAALGMPVVVDNRVGAHGLIAVQHFMSLSQDGRSAFLGSTVVPYVAKAHPDQAFELLKAVTPVHGVSKTDILLVVSAASDIKTVADLAAKGKRAGPLRAGTAAPQSNFLIAQSAGSIGVPYELVRYKQTGQMFIDLSNNEIDFVASAASGAGLNQMIEANKLRVLAVLGSKRSKSHPSIPTLTELGYAPVNDFAWSGVFVHSSTAAQVRRSIESAVKSAIASPTNNFIPFDASAADLAHQVQREYRFITVD